MFESEFENNGEITVDSFFNTEPNQNNNNLNQQNFNLNNNIEFERANNYNIYSTNKNGNRNDNNTKKKNEAPLDSIRKKINEINNSINFNTEKDKSIRNDRNEGGPSIYNFFQDKKEKKATFVKCIKNVNNNKKNEKCIICQSTYKNYLKVCPNCLFFICKNCLNKIFANTNVNNNNEEYDDDNADNKKEKNEKECPNCHTLLKIEEFFPLNNLNKNPQALQIYNEDKINCINNNNNNKIDIMNNEKEKTNIISNTMKNLEDQYTDCGKLIKKIECKKKEIDFQKHYYVGIINFIKNKIEEECDHDSKVLNDICTQLKTYQNKILETQSKIMMEEKKNSNNNYVPQPIDAIMINKNIIDNFYGYYKNFEDDLSKEIKFKGFQIYESKYVPIDLMNCNKDNKYLLIYSNNNIGDIYLKAFIEEDEFTGNVINFNAVVSQNNMLIDKLRLYGFNYNEYLNKNVILAYLIINKDDEVRFLKFGKQINNTNNHSISFKYSLNENELNFTNNSDSKSKIFNLKLKITEINI